LKPKRLLLLLAGVAALCLCSLPARAGVLFTDLGPTGSVYNCCTGWTVSGSGAVGNSFVAANEFTVAGIGSLSVGEIDLGVSVADGHAATFYASIWTDDAHSPGTELASWNLSTSTLFGTCCGLVSETGITGLTLTGGQQYFMVLGPLSLSDNSWTPWNWNSTGVTGLDLYSENGGSWHNNGTQTLGAFEIDGAASGVPEPGALLLLGTGFIAILGAARRKLNR